MKRNILTSALLSLTLLLGGMTAYGQHREHRSNQSGHRTEQSRHDRDKKHSRPHGNSNHKGDNKHKGDKHKGDKHKGDKYKGDKYKGDWRPGHPAGNSYNRPGANPPKSHYKHPKPHHKDYRPAPPRHPRRHPHYNGYYPRPSAGISISFGGLNLWYSNGLYYNRYSPTQYVVTLPPVGLVVQSLFEPVYRWVNNGYYFVPGRALRACSRPIWPRLPGGGLPLLRFEITET